MAAWNNQQSTWNQQGSNQMPWNQPAQQQPQSERKVFKSSAVIVPSGTADEQVRSTTTVVGGQTRVQSNQQQTSQQQFSTQYSNQQDSNPQRQFTSSQQFSNSYGGQNQSSPQQQSTASINFQQDSNPQRQFNSSQQFSTAHQNQSQEQPQSTSNINFQQDSKPQQKFTSSQQFSSNYSGQNQTQQQPQSTSSINFQQNSNPQRHQANSSQQNSNNYSGQNQNQQQPQSTSSINFQQDSNLQRQFNSSQQAVNNYSGQSQNPQQQSTSSINFQQQRSVNNSQPQQQYNSSALDQNMATMTMQQPPTVASKPGGGAQQQVRSTTTVIGGQTQQSAQRQTSQQQFSTQYSSSGQDSNQQQQQFSSTQNVQQQRSVNNQQQQQQYNNVQQQQQYGNQQQPQQIRGQPSSPQQQRRPQQQPQQNNHVNNNGHSLQGVPQSPTGAGGAPSFLAKKHFVANQAEVEWKNRTNTMRRVERSNSQAFRESQQVDSDEDGHLPEFTSTIHDIVDLREGERAHFDCCLIPQLVGDLTLKIVWSKDGQVIQQSNRFLIQESFGRLSLDILGVRQEDQGRYQVHVSNSAGDAMSEGTLKVLPARGFQSAGANQVDGASRFIPENIHEEQSSERPAFSENLAESLSVEEGEPLRLQATLSPANDSLMQVDWTFNGRPLLLGSRLATFYDFGLVTLSILDTRSEDSGVYVCRARNSLGQAESSCRLSCQPKGKSVVKPMFQEPMVSTPGNDLNEGDYVHLETRIEPRNDPYVIIEWFHNNRLIQTGQRLRPHHDFGIVTLDIVGAYAEDTGAWTVKATNSLGSDSSSVTIKVTGKPGLLLESQHPEGLEKIAELEYKDFSREYTYNDSSKHEPRFTEQLARLPDFNEGDKLRLEAQVEPRGDPNMKVEWFMNGRPVNNGHRTRTVFDFGFASLDVIDIQTRDAGEYVMRATNSLGTAESKTFLKVIGRGGIVSDPQYAASIDKIRDLESYQNGPTFLPDNIQEDRPTAAPTFAEPFKPVPELREGQSIHLECTVHPPNDPTQHIEWFFNGRPLQLGSRFRTFNDFGCIGLDILTVIPEDSGQYTIKASNAVGSNTSSVEITVKGRASIILESQAPNGAEKIRELEDMLNYKPVTTYEDIAHMPPTFTKQLSGPDGKVKEGQSIHLECQVQPINDPTLRIEWFFNGRPLNTGSRCRFTHDLEYVALDMMYVFPRDAGEYAVKLTNSAGTCVSATTVYCFAKKNIVTESLNPRALKKIQDLEAWNL